MSSSTLVSESGGREEHTLHHEADELYWIGNLLVCQAFDLKGDFKGDGRGFQEKNEHVQGACRTCSGWMLSTSVSTRQRAGRSRTGGVVEAEHEADTHTHISNLEQIMRSRIPTCCRMRTILWNMSESRGFGVGESECLLIRMQVASVRQSLMLVSHQKEHHVASIQKGFRVARMTASLVRRYL